MGWTFAVSCCFTGVTWWGTGYFLVSHASNIACVSMGWTFAVSCCFTGVEWVYEHCVYRHLLAANNLHGFGCLRPHVLLQSNLWYTIFRWEKGHRPFLNWLQCPVWKNGHFLSLSLFEFERDLFLNRFAIALIDELVTSVLLVTAGCSAILLARHWPFLGFLGFSFFSFLSFFVLFAGVFLELELGLVAVRLITYSEPEVYQTVTRLDGALIELEGEVC